ncbi:class I SAM-dependent methyltransferase [soil metagenome]
MLDAGCGAGHNLQLYSRLGVAEGFDPSPDAVAYCRRRGLENVRLGTMEEIPFEASSFDLLTATDVLEHVTDDGRGMRELSRVAAPGASLMLTVPAYDWLWSEEDERLGHMRRYTRPALRALARRSGWEPMFDTYFNTVLLAPIVVARKLRQCAGARQSAELALTPRALDRLLCLPMRLEARLIAAGISIPAGVSVGLVCRAVKSPPSQTQG